jgi:hypothetical protein
MASNTKTNTTKVKKPRKFATDIFETLRRADKNDLEYYDNLTEEQQKATAPLTIMRWMSAVSSIEDPTTNEYSITSINEVVNVGFWDLTRFPDLQWRLIAACGQGSTCRHEWIKAPAGFNTTKFDNLLLSLDQSMNHMELEIAKSKFDEQKVEQLCRQLAMDDKEIKAIITEYQKYKATKQG